MANAANAPYPAACSREASARRPLHPPAVDNSSLLLRSDGRSHSLPGEGALSAGQSLDALSAAIARAGFQSAAFAGMLLMRPDAEWLAAFERAHVRPPGFFAASMARFSGAPPRAGALELFADGLRLIESGDANERRAYLVRARQFAAVSLRTGGGGGYGVALLAGCIRALLDGARPQDHQ